MWHICITAFHLNSVFNRLHQLLEFGVWSDIFSPSLVEKQQWETCRMSLLSQRAQRQAGGTAYRDVCVWCSSAEPIRHSPSQFKPQLGLAWVIKAHFLCSRTVRHREMKWFTPLKRWRGAIREKQEIAVHCSGVTWPCCDSPWQCLSVFVTGRVAHRQCQGFSKRPSYISQNFTGASAVLQHPQVLCRMLEGKTLCHSGIPSPKSCFQLLGKGFCFIRGKI